MAYTSIWSVKGWLGKVVIYVENPEKTENPAYYEKQGMTAAQAQDLSDVIDYAAQTRKTQITDENAEVLRHYVSAVNCQVETARDEMMAVKYGFGKPDGVVAYHGIQSFAPGEVTPDIAHEIGVMLAERLWGDKYQVIVTTHLDTKSHIHSHFVVNTVSMVDGIRYHRTKQDYYNMQRESDALCREYGLSVIEEPKRGQSKHYSEWQADQTGKPTYRGLIKTDVDTAIRQSMTEQQFWQNLRRMGYHIKFGQDITIRAEGKDRGLKLKRNFGMDYSIEGIRRRILAQTRPERRIIPPERSTKQSRRVNGTIRPNKRKTGLRALYFYYLYRMGVIPKKREPNPKQVYFLFREDIRFIQKISQETRLLAKHGIDTDKQLSAHKESVTSQIAVLSDARKRLRTQARGIQDTDRLAAVKGEIAALSGKIVALRKEVRLCENVATRSVEMRDKLRRARAAEKSEGKELTRHDPIRRRR